MAPVLPLLLLLLLSSSSPTIRAAAGVEEHDEYTLVAMSSLEPKATCAGHRGTIYYWNQNLNFSQELKAPIFS
jgi:hypothetical protein